MLYLLFEIYVQFVFDIKYTSLHWSILGYYTVDCTIPKYIWTSAYMTSISEEPIGESNMVKSS